MIERERERARARVRACVCVKNFRMASELSGRCVEVVCCYGGSGDSNSGGVCKTVHEESLSAITHLVGGAIWVGYAAARPHLLPTETLAEWIHVSAVATFGCTFLVSFAFHVWSEEVLAAACLRTLDFSAVYTSLVASAISVLACVSDSFDDVPPQSIVDAALAPCVLLVLFVARRCLLRADDTVVSKQDAPTVYHSDLWHTSVRHGGGIIAVLQFFLLAPAAFGNFEIDVAVEWLVLVCSSTFLLLGGGTLLVPFLGCIQCIDKRTGKDGNAHAIWHVFACASSALLLWSNEVLLGALRE